MSYFFCSEAEFSSLSSHPLGPLAGLAVLAQEWRTRGSGAGATWVGLWHPTQQSDILATVAEHAQRMDAATLKRLARRGALPGVRDYSLLWALLSIASSQSEHESCVTNTKSNPNDFAASTTAPTVTEDEDDSAAILSLPIWNHGMLAQATLTPVRHAIHLVRYLDDYHEPTLAALRRQRLRKLVNAEPDEHRRACQAVAEAFLEQPTRWRDVVETPVHLSAVRACEQHLGQRIKGPGRTAEQLLSKLETGLAALAMGGAAAVADQLFKEFHTRLERLKTANVVLMYDEHEYLQLTGIREGRSVRRHLPRGLHLVFSDQQHRRQDRTAGLWLDQSDEAHAAGRTTLPTSYRRRMRRASSAPLFAYPTPTRYAGMSKANKFFILC